MTAIASGAALYATTRDIPEVAQQRDLTKAQLTLKYPETTVEVSEMVGVIVDRSKTEGELPSDLSVSVTTSHCTGFSSLIENPALGGDLSSEEHPV